MTAAFFVSEYGSVFLQEKNGAAPGTFIESEFQPFILFPVTAVAQNASPAGSVPLVMVFTRIMFDIVLIE